MTVTALPVRDEFTGSSGQTVFNYTFLIFTNLDLNVYITPSGQDADDATDITTAYTVNSGSLGNPIGGFITLNSGVSSGDLVTIVSNIVDNRTTDYQNSGDFLPDTVNDDLDRVVSLTKQQEDRSSRTLAFPESLQNATALTLSLPEAGRYLAWKDDESGVENVGAPGVIIPNTSESTVATMKANTALTIGLTVQTQGYGAAGDGADALYLIVANQAVDTYGDHLLVNGLVALMQISASTGIIHYGAKASPTVSTLNIQAAINALEVVRVDGPDLQPTIFITGNLIGKEGLTVESSTSCTLRLDDNINKSILNIREVDNCQVRGLIFDLNPVNNAGSIPPGESHSGVEIRSSTIVEDCTFSGMKSAGVFGYGSNCRILRNRFIEGVYSEQNGTACLFTGTTGLSYNSFIENELDTIGYGMLVHNTSAVGEGNRFISNTARGLLVPVVSLAQAASVNAWRCRETVIHDNTAIDCDGPCVRLIDFSQESQVTDNKAINCGLDGTPGFDIGDSNGNLDKALIIDGNIAFGCGGPGFWFTSVHESIISNNISTANGIGSVPDFQKSGFVIESESDSASTPVKDNIFIGNKCSLNRQGIGRSGTNAGVIVDNLHVGNDYADNTSQPVDYNSNTDKYFNNSGGGDVTPTVVTSEAYGTANGAIAYSNTNSSTTAQFQIGFDNNAAFNPGTVFRGSNSASLGVGTGDDFSGSRVLTALASGDVTMYEDGKGLIVVSPDGLVTKRIGIDNAGAISVTSV